MIRLSFQRPQFADPTANYIIAPHLMIRSLVLILGLLVFIPVILRLTLTVHGEPKNWRDRVLLRYEILLNWKNPIAWPRAIYVWMFALIKMRLDPMFHELPEFLDRLEQIETALDIGCGFGIAGCALLEHKPLARIFAVDPSRQCVRVAQLVFGPRGQAFVGAAPDFVRNGMTDRVDLVLILDVIHFIPDGAFSLTLQRIHDILTEHGNLILRAIIPPTGTGSIWWNIAKLRRFLTGSKAHHRTVDEIRQALHTARFEISNMKSSGNNPEMWWFVATCRDEAAET